MPNIKNSNPELLLKITRGNKTETIHNGWICVMDKSKKVIYKKGNINDYIFPRSSFKPIQAIPLIENNIGLSQEELAITCASHSGSERHINLLKHLLKKTGLVSSLLQCGIHEPSDEKEKQRLHKRNLPPNVLHNNCSGKHIGMLLVCKKRAWDLKTYLDPNHPLQKLIFNKVKELSETEEILTAIDGCSAPAYSLPVINTAKMFSNFTIKQEHLKIISAMRSNPYLIGAKGQIDSEIIKASNRKLISKVGAEGVIIVAYEGNAAVIKIADGSQKARSIVVLRLLTRLGWLKENQIKNSTLEKAYDLKCKNHAGKVVGEIKAVF